jgi:hypothetical protein
MRPRVGGKLTQEGQPVQLTELDLTESIIIPKIVAQIRPIDSVLHAALVVQQVATNLYVPV